MGFVRSNRRILSKGPLQAVTPVPAAPRPHRQPFDTSHLGVIVAGFGFTLAWFRRLAQPVVGVRFLEDVDTPHDGDTSSLSLSRGLR